MLVLLIEVVYDVLWVPDPAPLGLWTNFLPRYPHHGASSRRDRDNTPCKSAGNQNAAIEQRLTRNGGGYGRKSPRNPRDPRGRASPARRLRRYRPLRAPTRAPRGARTRPRP